MRMLVVGSVALDDIKTPFGEKKNVLGGAASHFSIAAAIWLEPKIIAVVGHDFPAKHLRYLAGFGIDVSGIEKSPDKTFHWSGYYEHDMAVAHTRSTELGAFASFEPKLSEEDRLRQVLFLANIDPDLQYRVLRQMRNVQLVGMDSMNFWIESKNKALWRVVREVDILFLNDAEIRMLAGEPSLIKAAKAVQRRGPKIVIVKKGEHGVLVVSRNHVFASPAYPTEKVIDPTGAGDSFAGGGMGYLVAHAQPGSKITDELLRRAVAWGTATASFAVEGFATTGIARATKEKIAERVEVLRQLSAF
ncbi:MAG: PfkB family carbohydrate kinase [Turneriella sp.]|nr:PfkB family carbohydrate kinase [Turneriella sp.]